MKQMNYRLMISFSQDNHALVSALIYEADELQAYDFLLRRQSCPCFCFNLWSRWTTGLWFPSPKTIMPLFLLKSMNQLNYRLMISFSEDNHALVSALIYEADELQAYDFLLRRQSCPCFCFNLWSRWTTGNLIKPEQ